MSYALYRQICPFGLLIDHYFICSVAHFLESRGMIEDALEVATDPDYRFELAIQLGKLEIAKVSAVKSLKEHFLALSICKSTCTQRDRHTHTHVMASKIIYTATCFLCTLDYQEYLCKQDIATVAQSESKWKQLGELAMSTGMVSFHLDLLSIIRVDSMIAS